MIFGSEARSAGALCACAVTLRQAVSRTGPAWRVARVEVVDSGGAQEGRGRRGSALVRVGGHPRTSMGAYARDAGNLNRAHSWIQLGVGSMTRGAVCVAGLFRVRVATRSPRGAGSNGLAKEKTWLSVS